LFFSYESRPEIVVPAHTISAVEWLFLNTFCMHLIDIPTYHITQTHTILIQHFGATTTWDAPTRLEFGMIIATTMVSSSNIEYMMIKSTSALQLGLAERRKQKSLSLENKKKGRDGHKNTLCFFFI
jgi:hypothetical protein